MKAHPKILLEVLTPFSLKLVLFVCYSVLAISIALSFFPNLAYQSLTYNAAPCSSSNSSDSFNGIHLQIPSCTQVNQWANNTKQNSTWSVSFELKKLELYFSVSLQLNRNEINAPEINFQTTVDIAVFAENEGYNSNNSSESLQETFFLNKIIFVSCPAGKQCFNTALLDEEEYIYNIDHLHTKFNFTIAFIDIDPSFHVNSTSSNYLLTYHAYV